MDLTEQQRTAIADPSSKLQLIACAGSGKTEVISRRITRWLREGADPKSIVAFTFTERAAAELKARIYRHVEEEIGQEQVKKLGPMYAGTIHGYCLRILQDFGSELANFEIIDDHRQVALLFREHKRLKLAERLPIFKGTFDCIHGFIRNLDVVYNELIDLSQFQGKEIEPFRQAVHDFETALNSYRVMTYGQIIAHAVRRLETNEAMRAKVHGSLKFLVVDEYQDVNQAQEKLISILTAAPADLTVVGDDDQAIYQWRGSSVENIVKFVKRYKAKSLPLLNNHRSRPHIVRSANSIALGIADRLEKQMNAVRGELPGAVCIWEAENPQEEAEGIAKTITSLLEKGYRGSEIAILCRSVRTSGKVIMDALQQAGVPFQASGRTGLFERPEVRFLFMAYAYLADQEWRPSRYDPGIKLTPKELGEQFAQTAFARMDTEKATLKYLSNRRALITAGGKVELVGDYYALLKIMGANKLDARSNADANILHNCARFSQVLTDFEHMTRRARPASSEELAERQAKTATELINEPAVRFVQSQFFHQRLATYIQWYGSESYEEDSGEIEIEENAVQVMTIHQAKGLEFPIVFVPGMVGQRFPSKNTGRTQTWFVPEELFDRKRYEGSLNDEKRLFYVAITRAKEALYVSRFRRQKNKTKASPFFTDLLGHEQALDYSKSNIPIPNITPAASRPSEAVREFYVSELLAYKDCPYAYNLRQELEFQPPMARELGYGKVVHHLLHLLAVEAMDTGKVPTEVQLKELMDTHFYLPFANRAAFKDMKKAVDGHLIAFLKKNGTELLRVREPERRFQMPIKNISVVGRADVVLDEAGGPKAVALVDYKTGIDTEDATSLDAYRMQLQIYAAAGRLEGLDTKAAYLHDLKEQKRIQVEIGPEVEKKAVAEAFEISNNIATGCFDARLSRRCKDCDVKTICKFNDK